MALTFVEVQPKKKLTFAEVKTPVSEPEEQTNPIWDKVAHAVGVSGRAVAQGLASALGIVGDPLNTIVNQFLPDEKKLQTLRGATQQVLKGAGVPDYEGKTEKLLGTMGELAVETVATAGAAGVGAKVAKGTQTALSPVTKPATKVMSTLAEEPVKQAVAAEAGLLTGKAAEAAMPGSPVSGLIGNIVGAVGAGKLTGMGASAYKEPDIITRGKEHGVNIHTSDVYKPKGTTGEFVQMVTERAPMGTKPLRVKQTEQQKEMITRYVEEIGADTPENLKAAIIEDVVKKRKGMFERFAGLKKDIFDRLDKKGSVPAIKLTKVIDDELALAKHNNLDAYVKELENLRDQVTAAVQPAGAGQIKQASIKSMDKARSLFGEKLSTDDFAGAREHIGKSQKKIYAAFKEDMGNFIKKEGKPNDYKKWVAFDKKISNLIAQERMGSFKRALKQATIEPEVVKTMLKTENESVAKMLYKSASPQGKKLIRAGLIQDIVERSGGIENLTPEKFVKEISKRGRATGVYFDKKNRDVLKSMKQLMDDTEQAKKAAAHKSIGVYAPVVGYGLLTHYIGALPAAVTVTGLGILSRVIESKPTRDLLLRYGNLVKKKAPDKAKAAIARQLHDAVLAFKKEENNNE